MQNGQFNKNNILLYNRKLILYKKIYLQSLSYRCIYLMIKKRRMKLCHSVKEMVIDIILKVASRILSHLSHFHHIVTIPVGGVAHVYL